MFSKITWRSWGFVLISGSLLLTGCEKFLNGRSQEEKREAQIVTISTDEVKCLKSTPDELRKFFADQGDATTLPKTVGCIESSLKTFLRLTRGSHSEGYLATEVQYFFNTFLMKENKVSDGFLREIMKIKVVVVGGSSDFVTRLEMEQFVQFLHQFQMEMQKLNGKMKVALFKGDTSHRLDNQSLESIQKDLHSLTAFILKSTKLTSSRYQWVDFISFLHELRGFVGNSTDLEEIFKWVPLAESVKLLFLGENAKLVSEGDWIAASQWAVNTYTTALKFRYQIKDSPFETPQQWNVLLSWLDEGIEALEASPAMRDRKILEAKAVDRMIDEVFKLQMFQTVLSPEMTKATYRKALVHFIETPQGRGDPLTIQGLSEAHLRILKQEYKVWKLSQRFLIDTYSQFPSLKLINLRWYVERYDFEKAMGEYSLMEKEVLFRSWQDFKGLLLNHPAITYDRKMKVRVAPRSEVEEYTFVGANLMNGLRSFTRLVLRGYGDRQSRFLFDSKIQKNRLVHMEEDFRDFGRAIGILDPRETNAAARFFDQGNFFTLHGNGDKVLSAIETFEVFNLMMSGARTQLLEMYADLQAENCLVNRKDIFNKNYVRERCFYDLLQKRAHIYLDNMPGMARFIQSLDSKNWARVYKALLSLSLSKTHESGLLESSEIRSLNTLLHFIETLIVVYDADHNGQLSETEVAASLPRFGPFIESMIEKKPSWIDRTVGPYFLEDILLFLVYEGREPSGTDLVTFKAERALGLGQAGRDHLVTLLSVLNNLLNTTTVNVAK